MQPLRPTLVERPDGRKADEMRPIHIRRDIQKHALGSVQIEFGDTHVLCSVCVEPKVPEFLVGRGQGWLTAEYSMLPGATHSRSSRESSRGKVGGRTHEIQRLIGRSLRASIDLKAVGEHTFWIDCDVIQADAGTRTAAITGAYVALVLALEKLDRAGRLTAPPIVNSVAAVSVGVVGGCPVLDLCFQEDQRCDVDMNVVMTGDGQFIEVQGTAEKDPFSEATLNDMLNLAKSGLKQLQSVQTAALADINLLSLRQHSWKVVQ